MRSIKRLFIYFPYSIFILLLAKMRNGLEKSLDLFPAVDFIDVRWEYV